MEPTSSWDPLTETYPSSCIRHLSRWNKASGNLESWWDPCWGVTLFWALMFASCSKSCMATLREGMRAAKCSAVLPLMSTKLGSASCSRRRDTQRSCWHCTACQKPQITQQTLSETLYATKWTDEMVFYLSLFWCSSPVKAVHVRKGY